MKKFLKSFRACVKITFFFIFPQQYIQGFSSAEDFSLADFRQRQKQYFIFLFILSCLFILGLVQNAFIGLCAVLYDGFMCMFVFMYVYMYMYMYMYMSLYMFMFMYMYMYVYIGFDDMKKGQKKKDR